MRTGPACSMLATIDPTRIKTISAVHQATGFVPANPNRSEPITVLVRPAEADRYEFPTNFGRGYSGGASALLLTTSAVLVARS